MWIDHGLIDISWCYFTIITHGFTRIIISVQSYSVASINKYEATLLLNDSYYMGLIELRV